MVVFSFYFYILHFLFTFSSDIFYTFSFLSSATISYFILILISSSIFLPFCIGIFRILLFIPHVFSYAFCFLDLLLFHLVFYFYMFSCCFYLFLHPLFYCLLFHFIPSCYSFDSFALFYTGNKRIDQKEHKIGKLKRANESNNNNIVIKKSKAIGKKY